MLSLHHLSQWEAANIEGFDQTSLCWLWVTEILDCSCSNK